MHWAIWTLGVVLCGAGGDELAVYDLPDLVAMLDANRATVEEPLTLE